MIVLGFNGVMPEGGIGAGHDAAAAILVDGEIVAAAEEERFIRTKHSSAFPQQAIQFCLDSAGVELEQVDHFCFHWDPALYRSLLVQAELANWEVEAHLANMRLKEDVFSSFTRAFDWTPPTAKQVFVRHHLAHAASAYYCSPFDRAAYLIVDNHGEGLSTSFGLGADGKIEQRGSVLLPASLGQLYARVTALLGFRPLSDEYKVMGLAAYGDGERFRKNFETMWQPTSDGLFEFRKDHAAFQAWLELDEFRRYGEHDDLNQVHRDLAASLQRETEKIILRLAKHAVDVAGESRLCMAGGVGLNSTANGVLARSGIVEDLWIHPAAGDAGTSLGAALYHYHQTLGQREVSKGTYFSPYLGSGFDDAAVTATLEDFAAEIEFHRPEDLSKEVAKALADGNIVGWFQGRMEWGPRALGNRSIIGDPRSAEMKDRLNALVKHREEFRPFAPAVQAEHVDEYFEMGVLKKSPYMLHTFPVVEDKKESIAGIVHADGTARAQTVEKEQNPRFWSLLGAFGELTGIPMLINTSFNVRGETIVRTPEDAIQCFLSTDINLLVVGDWVIRRKQLSDDEVGSLNPLWESTTTLKMEGEATAKGQSIRYHIRRHHIGAELSGEVAESLPELVRLADGTRSTDEVTTELAKRYEEDEQEDAAEDFRQLIDHLLKVRLLRLKA